MKKMILSAVAATAMLTALAVSAVMTPGAALACPHGSPAGDFDASGKVDILDYGLLYQVVNGIIEVDDSEPFDLNHDGVVNEEDLVRFQKMYKHTILLECNANQA